jgi:hypothetical protein
MLAAVSGAGTVVTVGRRCHLFESRVREKVYRAAQEPHGQETMPQRGRCRNGERPTLPWDEAYTPGNFGRLVVGGAISGVAYWG